MEQKKYYRICFVPECKNNEKKCPEKIFVSVPKDNKKPKLWFTQARRSYQQTSSNFYCCEDHFNVSIL